MTSGKCARAFRHCDQPAGGYKGRFTDLCFRCARSRCIAIELQRRTRRQRLLGGAR